MVQYNAIEIPFKELVIKCSNKSSGDAETHIIADGKELGDGCTFIRFVHDTQSRTNSVRLESVVILKAEQ